MEWESRAERPLLRLLVQDGLQIPSAVQHLNNKNRLFLGPVTIEDHVFWKAGNEYPSQSRESRRPETAWSSALRQAQQGVHRLIHGLLPPLGQGEIRNLMIVVRLLDDREGGGLGDAQFDHWEASFSRRTETRVRPFNSSGVMT